MNIAFWGDLFIWVAATCVLASGLLFGLTWSGQKQWHTLARRFFWIGTGSIISAVALLLVLILNHDFSIAYVHSYSSTDLPLGYLISSLWAGQEGTFLLWIMFCGILGLILMYTARQFEYGGMMWLNLFILSVLLIVIKKSPFEMLPVAQIEGAGLNPLLQNFWMQIHPPIMFVGFAGAVFPACFALTALVSRRYSSWAESARRWTMFAWSALGVSLVMGGYWAYKTLGWGGFWAWDPVENSSFIPWIFLTAQVHTLFIQRQRGGLVRFSLFVVLMSFWAVLYGTFLTRSGVLADFSVHSFIDLGINQFLIGGLILFVAVGSGLLLWRWQDITPKPSYSRVASRSYIVTIGILILFLGGVLTLIGTSAPLLTRFSDNPSNVGLPYYFTTMTPVGVAILAMIALFPAFRWNDGIARSQFLIAGAAAAITTAVILIATGLTREVIYLLLFGLASWAIVVNGWVVFNNARKRHFAAGYFAHIGLALALVGAATSAGFETKRTLILPRDVTVEAMDCSLTFVSVNNRSKGFDCHVEVTTEGETFMAVLPHEFPSNAEGVMRKPHVEKYFDHDLYLAPVAMEQPEQDDPGTIILEKGQTATLDKYEIEFHDFELAGHGDDGPRSASALLTFAFDDKKEDVSPSVSVVDGQVEPSIVSVDYGRATVHITGVRPDDGAVVLKVSGDFLPEVEASQASLVIELSRKPWISLFWIGTIIMFLSGALSMRKRRRQDLPGNTRDKTADISSDTVTQQVSTSV
ncbi:MAG: cytochrome c biogenesis protein CcsA [Candidatus Zixiibacteriota bacterium]